MDRPTVWLVRKGRDVVRVYATQTDAVNFANSNPDWHVEAWHVHAVSTPEAPLHLFEWPEAVKHLGWGRPVARHGWRNGITPPPYIENRESDVWLVTFDDDGTVRGAVYTPTAMDLIASDWHLVEVK